VRHSIDTLQTLIADWIEAILARAEAAGNAGHARVHAPATGRTRPLVAHWLLAYVEMFLRDASRLADCRKRANLCPLGSGAVAGATLTLNRQAMAAELGFDGPTANSIDATSDRDFAIEFVDALSMLALHLSRWAEEMILFSTSAYGFVELPEPYSTGSSAMPQKKNPDLLELVRGKAARVMGCATTLQTLVKGLPLAYNKDLQETQEPVFNASDTIIAMLPLVTGFMNTVEFNDAKMNQAAQFGIHERLGRGRLSRRARSALAPGSRGGRQSRCSGRGARMRLQKLPLADLQAIHASFDAGFHSCLGLPRCSRCTMFPAAPRLVT
jgi:argininosuccinate lyase